MAVTLVLRALGLGDLLTAVPALRGLRRARPDDEIVLAAPAALEPLVPFIDAVDELLPTSGLAELPAQRLPEAPALAVNLHGRGPESIADLRATAPARLLSHRHPAFPGLDGPRWNDETHEVRRWCALLEYGGITADPDELSLSRPRVPSPAPGAVVLHPGAASAARRWPSERFAELARALAGDLTRAASAGTTGADAGLPASRVVVTGSAAERELALEVAGHAGLDPGAVLVGRDLSEMAALVAEAALVVCGDTGIGHLATALRTPSVLLFGPTPPGRWGPPADRPWHRVLWAGTLGDPHADTPDPGLLRLTVPDVLEDARTLLFLRSTRSAPRPQLPGTRDRPPGEHRGGPDGERRDPHYGSAPARHPTTDTARGRDSRGLSVGVVGTGYVGLTSAACLARLGHTVWGVDIDSAKVDGLNRGVVPIAEPELPELVRTGLAEETLRFGTDLAALATADVVLLCVPTPPGPEGTVDLSVFDAVLTELADALAPGCVVVVKSTVPVGTTARTARLLDRSTVSNPEFLREGHAVQDFLHPDRIVLGAGTDSAAERVAALYSGIDAPLVRTDPASAELAKYASNAFLALKLSYVNVLAELCERVRADVADVTSAMALDPRIGAAFLSPGPGWGGSCLPKDIRALRRTAEESGVEFALLSDAIATNEHQHDRVLHKIREAVTGSSAGSLAGVRLGLLGLTFKAGTDDVRESPALAVAARLTAEGAILTGYDPGVDRCAAPTVAAAGVQSVDDATLVAKDAAGIVLLTEWPQFRRLNWAQLAELAERPVVIDTRGLFDADDRAGMAAAGFHCHGLGR